MLSCQLYQWTRSLFRENIVIRLPQHCLNHAANSSKKGDYLVTNQTVNKKSQDCHAAVLGFYLTMDDLGASVFRAGRAETRPAVFRAEASGVAGDS